MAILWSESGLGTLRTVAVGFNRSSTIFPLYADVGVRNLLVFSDYWDKRYLRGLTIKLTLRQATGEVFDVRTLETAAMRAREIDVENCFSINLADFGVGHSCSLEIEIFYPTEPRFTYPAVSIVYASRTGSAVVHACLRTLNKDEVLTDPFVDSRQTGFDTPTVDGIENYAIFVAGTRDQYAFEISWSCEETVVSKQVCVRGNTKSLHKISLDAPREVYGLLGQSHPKVSIRHDMDDVFPRLYILSKDSDIDLPTLTHSFFDVKDELLRKPHLASEAYVQDFRAPAGAASSSLIVPLFDPKSFRTSLECYDSTAPFVGVYCVALRAMNGDLIERRFIESSPGGFLQSRHSVDFTNFFSVQTDGDNYQVELTLVESDVVPRRQKLGFNVAKAPERLGCNICFAPSVLEGESATRRPRHRWAPIGGSLNFIATIHNTCYGEDFERDSEFVIQVYDSMGDYLEQTVVLPPYGGYIIDTDPGSIVGEFLGGRIGYIFVSSESFGYNSFFFSLDGQLVSGDHAF